MCSFSTLHLHSPLSFFFFFFNDTATTEIYTLSLHDALPIYLRPHKPEQFPEPAVRVDGGRSEEHTSELQSRVELVCRLLLEKKNKNQHVYTAGEKLKEKSIQQLVQQKT